MSNRGGIALLQPKATQSGMLVLLWPDLVEEIDESLCDDVNCWFDRGKRDRLRKIEKRRRVGTFSRDRVASIMAVDGGGSQIARLLSFIKRIDGD